MIWNYNQHLEAVLKAIKRTVLETQQGINMTNIQNYTYDRVLKQDIINSF